MMRKGAEYVREEEDKKKTRGKLARKRKGRRKGARGVGGEEKKDKNDEKRSWMCKRGRGRRKRQEGKKGM